MTRHERGSFTVRSMALHEVLDNVEGLEVKSWGDTDDSQRTHEVVEIVIEFGKWLAQPEQLQAIGTAAVGIGKVLGTRRFNTKSELIQPISQALLSR